MLGSSFLRAPPSPGEVHLWLLDPSKVDDPVLLDVYSTFLNDEEREIVGQGASEEARKERLLTRVLARTTLARCELAFRPFQVNYYTEERSCSVISLKLNDQLTWWW